MPSPREIANHAGSPDQVRYRRDIDRAREEGRKDGKEALRKEVLDFLQREYMSPKIERGDNRASAILEVTRGLSQYLKNRTGR